MKNPCAMLYATLLYPTLLYRTRPAYHTKKHTLQKRKSYSLRRLYLVNRHIILPKHKCCENGKVVRSHDFGLIGISSHQKSYCEVCCKTRKEARHSGKKRKKRTTPIISQHASRRGLPIHASLGVCLRSLSSVVDQIIFDSHIVRGDGSG